MDHSCYLCLVFVMLSRLFIAALWSPEGKGLTFWLLFVMFFVPFGILGLVWYFIVSIPYPCCLSYFAGPTYHIVGNLMSRLKYVRQKRSHPCLTDWTQSLKHF